MKRKTPLSRKSFRTASPAAKRSRPSPISEEPRTLEPGEAAWKKRRYGRCRACETYGRVVLHHIVDEREVRQAGGDPWDQANAMRLGAPYAMGGRCQCHASHHLPGVRDTRLSYALVPPAAREFAVRVLGEGPAEVYFRRHYREVS